MTAITEDERQLFERVEKVIRENFRQMMHYLWDSWCHLGIDSETRYKRTEDLIGFTEDFHREVKMETDYKCQKLKEEIEALKAESAQLSRCLSIEISLTECYDGTPMYLEKNALEEQLKGYRRELQDRKTKITRLSEWQNDLCTALGTTFVEIADDPLPSEVELNKLKDHLEMLQEERDKRMTVFLNKQKDVKDLMAELGIQPVLKFEQEVVKSLSVEFKVTDRNMAKLCELHESLGMQLEETKNRVLELRERLHMLWERLEEEPCYRSNFLDAYPGCKPETEKALRDEIARCEEKKRQNIKVFVAKMRMEIKHLWDKCLYSNKEREEFYHYNCDVFTEDTLTLHELYLEKIQKYYAEIEPIYNLLQVRNDLWQKMLELEARANEPGRLHNRGGQLLKEEKERKTIASKLPKIETQLMELVKEHEMKCGKVFTVHGAPLMEKIAEEWEKRKMERQNKQSARKHQGGLTPSTPLVKNSMMLSPLGKRNMTAASLMRNNRTTTPAKKALLMVASASKLLTSQACNGLKRSAVTSVKRTTHQPPRQLVQDGAGPSLRRKLRYSGGRSDARSPHKVTIPKITVSGNTLKTKRLSGKHRSSTHRRNSHSRRLSKGLRAASSEDEAKKNQPVPPHSDSTMMTSYTDFQEHLHENTSSRSSLVPGRLLRARQNKENMNPNTIYENGTPNFKNKTTNIKQKQPLTPKSNMIMEVALAVTPNRVTRASLQKNNSTLLNVFATPRPPANKLKPQQQLQRQNTMTLSCPKMANQLMTRSNSTHNLKSPKLQMAKNLPLII